ncbi:MAG: hypothetical protein ACFB10_22490 [Salibacteraceae bacterium]
MKFPFFLIVLWLLLWFGLSSTGYATGSDPFQSQTIHPTQPRFLYRPIDVQLKPLHRVGASFWFFDRHYVLKYEYWRASFANWRLMLDSRLGFTVIDFFSTNYQPTPRRLSLTETLVLAPIRWRIRPEFGLGAMVFYNRVVSDYSNHEFAGWPTDIYTAIGPNRYNRADYRSRWQVRPTGRIVLVLDWSKRITTKVLVEGDQAFVTQGGGGGVFQYRYVAEIAVGLGRGGGAARLFKWGA